MTKDKKRISILGCGWLGYPLAVSLLQEGYLVKGSTTTKPKLNVLEKAGIEAFLLEVSGEAQAATLCAFLECDTLVIAYPPKIRANGPEPYLKSIEKLVGAIERSPVETVIFISSTSVYAAAKAAVTEDMEAAPQTESGKAVLRAEEQLRALKDQQTIVLRMAGLIGYERNPGRFLTGKTDLTNGRERVNLIHRDDCIKIIIQLLKKGHGSDVLNCCSDTHPFKKDFYTLAAEKAKLTPPVFSKNGEKSQKIVSNKKLKELLDYEFTYGDLSQFDWP